MQPLKMSTSYELYSCSLFSCPPLMNSSCSLFSCPPLINSIHAASPVVHLVQNLCAQPLQLFNCSPTFQTLFLQPLQLSNSYKLYSYNLQLFISHRLDSCSSPPVLQRFQNTILAASLAVHLLPTLCLQPLQTLTNYMHTVLQLYTFTTYILATSPAVYLLQNLCLQPLQLLQTLFTQPLRLSNSYKLYSCNLSSCPAPDTLFLQPL
jgi:hypothetical protein